MFKTLSVLTDNTFWRVSADTKTCGSPLYLSPAGGLCLPISKHTGILMYYQTIVNKKINKKALFFGCPEPILLPLRLRSPLRYSPSPEATCKPASEGRLRERISWLRSFDSSALRSG